MKAVFLVGGFGTRLRPLTLSKPKLLIEFSNKPMILHQIEALKAIGVTEVILAINYQPELMQSFLEKFEARLGIKITYARETEPLGTAGPLALARDQLLEGHGEPFFVLNSDFTCEFGNEGIIEFHRTHGGEASILVTKVDEKSKYGVVVLDEETGRVKDFVVKLAIFVGSKINAGIYMLNPSVLDRIQFRPTTLERSFSGDRRGKEAQEALCHGFNRFMDGKDYLAGLTLLRLCEEASAIKAGCWSQHRGECF